MSFKRKADLLKVVEQLLLQKRAKLMAQASPVHAKDLFAIDHDLQRVDKELRAHYQVDPQGIARMNVSSDTAKAERCMINAAAEASTLSPISAAGTFSPISDPSQSCVIEIEQPGEASRGRELSRSPLLKSWPMPGSDSQTEVARPSSQANKLEGPSQEDIPPMPPDPTIDLKGKAPAPVAAHSTLNLGESTQVGDVPYPSSNTSVVHDDPINRNGLQLSEDDVEVAEGNEEPSLEDKQQQEETADLSDEEVLQCNDNEIPADRDWTGFLYIASKQMRERKVRQMLHSPQRQSWGVDEQEHQKQVEQTEEDVNEEEDEHGREEKAMDEVAFKLSFEQVSENTSDEPSWDEEAAAQQEAELEASVEALVSRLAEAEGMLNQERLPEPQQEAEHKRSAHIDYNSQAELEMEGKSTRVGKGVDKKEQEELRSDHQLPQFNVEEDAEVSSGDSQHLKERRSKDFGESVEETRTNFKDQISPKSYANSISSGRSSCGGDMVQIESARASLQAQDQTESFKALENSPGQWSPRRPTESIEALCARNSNGVITSVSGLGHSHVCDLARDSLDLSTGKENLFHLQPTGNYCSQPKVKLQRPSSVPASLRIPMSEMQPKGENVDANPLAKQQYEPVTASPPIHITPRNLFGVDVSPVVVVDDFSSDSPYNHGVDEFLFQKVGANSSFLSTSSSHGRLLRDSPPARDGMKSPDTLRRRFISSSPPRYRATQTPSTMCSDFSGQEVETESPFWKLPVAKNQPLSIQTTQQKQGKAKYPKDFESSPSRQRGTRTHHLWTQPILGGALAQRPPGTRALSSTPRNHDNWRKSLQNARRQGDRSPAGTRYKPWR